MKFKKTLFTGVSVLAGVGAVIGALKVKKYLNREEILIKETDLFTHIDLHTMKLPEDVLTAIINKDYETYSIIIDSSAKEKFTALNIEADFDLAVWSDDDREKFYIFDSSNLNSNNNETDDLSDFEDLADYSDDEISPIA